MPRIHALLCALLLAATAPLGCGSPQEITSDPKKQKSLEEAVDQAVWRFKKVVPTIEGLFENSHGYAVFPNAGKGGFIFGGGHGDV